MWHGVHFQAAHHVQAEQSCHGDVYQTCCKKQACQTHSRAPRGPQKLRILGVKCCPRIPDLQRSLAEGTTHYNGLTESHGPTFPAVGT